MNALTPLFNRAGELPADAWFQVVPRGEWPHTGESGKQRLQVIDDAALDAMVNSFKPKVLVDQEHFSYDSEKSSEAFGRSLWPHRMDGPRHHGHREQALPLRLACLAPA